ncbi:hypothetical protein D7X55_37560 [Corallococcus sp. AB049A]|uniref:Uncharacterized protein n=1 Tax=Corallococcus interemptor TaxID=2316720 RepID=A0A3A8QV26_9BACT|nr:MULTISPECIES: hypothetical protein [Corallococcus]RKH52130.1 hypothetical protein D7Y23_07910 [Corallococcus sp. AB050B]RKH72606.1 hypothetical protein D7X96_04225 [Corallococcus interemptor]RKI45440.1 hypothetical protein D7X55_37560 [Corallococcus sp. AB049A]
MRYTRKNISELLGTVQGSPDVMGFWTSTIGGYTYNITPSAGGNILQDIYNPNHRICEDGGQTAFEDAAQIGCY